MYVLELGGEDDAFAVAEAASACTAVERLAPGLATARGITDRIRGLAFTHRANRLIGTCDPSVDDAVALLRAAAIDEGGTVAVRARDVRGRTGMDTQAVERALGDVLVERGFTVDLDDPDHHLAALFAGPGEGPTTDDGGRIDQAGSDPSTDATAAVRGSRTGVCALGWLVARSVRDFGRRQPTEKPFFQPGSMDPLLACAIANLAGARPGRRILDPMCGTGGVLVEAGLVGAEVIGTDVQPKMVAGAAENLRHYLDGGARVGEAPGTFAVARADATRLPIQAGSVDAVVFDVPYGRQSKAVERPSDPLVVAALEEASRLAPRCVFVGDRQWSEAASAAGWTVADVFERAVHRSLARHIHVLV